MKKLFGKHSFRLLHQLKRPRLSSLIKPAATLTISSLFLILKNPATMTTNLDSTDNDLEGTLEKFEKFLESKRGKVFQVPVGDLDFIPRSSSFTTKIKHPKIKEGLDILFVRDMEGEVTAFRANCPYDSEKVIRKGLVFGNKLICEHHGCEFHIKTGKVEKYPAMKHLVKLDLLPEGQQTNDTRLKALYYNDKTNEKFLDNTMAQKALKRPVSSLDDLDLNVYRYRLPEERRDLQFGEFLF